MSGGESLALVLIGDIVDSRSDRTQSAADISSIATLLNETFAGELLADFDYTSGDEIQGVMRAGADPFAVILAAHLGPAGRQMRWGIALGPIDPGSGPAIRRTGEAFIEARSQLIGARSSRTGIGISTGIAGADAIMRLITRSFWSGLGAMSKRQRSIAFLLLIRKLPQSAIAREQGVSRATISVGVARGGVVGLGELAAALKILLDGATRQREAQPA